ncbi:Insertion sequence IS5376 putative ATP-binding protein [Oceanivirga miroungae]|uniref:Insertion sequence IS5376 putative ATP-binding protein n=1 Tax=Oceanivirga miroungae TaxID=1130046 RepID=A0A6I8M9S7_9FUSO|nr:Insertion sequence IS5376 putative ATP-binding protein [Oceanivirga miroungae]VWL85356.1 Insertion sequence IS5376 putative ATP-binding protein [Oceanivirga miroungae]VWL85839.1 Insertion sequence IS5376 putative ATP-binding protein [Oceanivirga miroungae]
MITINDVLEKLKYLKLNSAYNHLKELNLASEISQEELNGINKVISNEVEAKEQNNRLYNVKVAAFPFVKTIEDYDFRFQPSIKEENIKNIINSGFYEEASNILFIGNPGTGKTHLSIAIGYEVAIKRNSVYFIN